MQWCLAIELPVLLVLSIGVLNPTTAANILVLASDASNSHILFWNRIVNILHSHGHSVTVWTLRVQSAGGPRYQLPASNITSFETIYDFGDFWSRFQDNLFTDSNQDSSVGTSFDNFNLHQSACVYQINDRKVMDRLQQQTFDLALVGTSDFCPRIIMKHLHISKMVMFSVEPLFDHISILMDLNRLPSYIPSVMAGTSDRMSHMMQRLQALVQQCINELVVGLWFTHWGKQNKLYESLYQRNLFLDYREATTGVLINGPSLIDFPRPFTHTQRFMGSAHFDANSKNANQLERKWIDIIDNEKSMGTILMVFGTNVNPYRIPQQTSEALLDALRPFHNYTVLWRYKNDVFRNSSIPSHVHIVEWLPQKALLAHSRTRLLITHGGCQGLVEAAHSAVPLVQVPLFVDHYSHAQRALRLGLSVVVDKNELLGGKLQDAIAEALWDKRYWQRAAAVSSMLRDSLDSESQTIDNEISRSLSHAVHKTTLKTVNNVTYFQIEIILLMAFVSAAFY